MNGAAVAIVFLLGALIVTVWEYRKLLKKYKEEEEHNFALRLELKEIRMYAEDNGIKLPGD